MVFVTQRLPGRDLSKAERFGKLQYLFHRDAYPDDVEERVTAFHRIACRILRYYNPKSDYVMLTGDPVAIGVVVGYLARHVGRIRVLKWDRENGGYFVADMDFNREESTDEYFTSQVASSGS